MTISIKNLLIILIIVAAGGAVYLSMGGSGGSSRQFAPSGISDKSAGRIAKVPPPLYTQGNKIIDSQTGQPVILKGVITDYFRFGMNYDYPTKYGGLEPEIENIERLKQAGVEINIIGLYLARLDKIKLNIGELDKFINYALDNNIYIYLAPTGNAFFETVGKDANKGFFEGVGPNDLAELTELLAERYGNYSNVLYQLTAEPSMSPSLWEIKQKELAAIVRKYTNNIIIVSHPYYQHYSSLPVLLYDNLIYSIGGYVSKNDNSVAEYEPFNKIILAQESLIQNYPVIVSEFGGNYGGNFSSDRDLDLFRDLLGVINSANMSHTVYRLSSAFKDDGLAIFDTEGKLTQKGKIFVSSFKDKEAYNLK